MPETVSASLRTGPRLLVSIGRVVQQVDMYLAGWAGTSVRKLGPRVRQDQQLRPRTARALRRQ